MCRIAGFVLAACLLVVFLDGGPARGQSSSNAAPAAALNVPSNEAGFDPIPPPEFLAEVDRIVEWIFENSPYDRMDTMPAFVKVPRTTINYIVYSQLPEGYQQQDCINALYTPPIILLAEDFETVGCNFTLVHELVHHLQWESAAEFRCTLEAEREAYEIQALWVMETGIGEMPSPLFLRRLTCNNPHDFSR